MLLWRAPDSKVHAANMGPIWDLQGLGWPHVGPMNFAIWGITQQVLWTYEQEYNRGGIVL